MPKFTPEYVANRVRVTTSGCWEWLGKLDKDGYGPYRAIYKALKGPIPAGKYLDHECRNRPCVNFDHLRPVSPRQNVLENSESLVAKFAQATHCIKGHPLSGENLYLRPSGGRRCRECGREATSRYREANIETVRAKDLARYYDERDERLVKMRTYYHEKTKSRASLLP